MGAIENLEAKLASGPIDVKPYVQNRRGKLVPVVGHQRSGIDIVAELHIGDEFKIRGRTYVLADGVVSNYADKTVFTVFPKGGGGQTKVTVRDQTKVEVTKRLGWRERAERM